MDIRFLFGGETRTTALPPALPMDLKAYAMSRYAFVPIVGIQVGVG